MSLQCFLSLPACPSLNPLRPPLPTRYLFASPAPPLCRKLHHPLQHGLNPHPFFFKTSQTSLAFSPTLTSPTTAAPSDEHELEEITNPSAPAPAPAPILPPSIDVAEDGTRKDFRLFYGSWKLQDVLITAQTCSVHVLAIFALFTFSWERLGLAFFLWLMTGLGITLSYHRNLCHRSFQFPKWMEYFWAYWGVQAMQGDPLWWVSNHRYHHQHTDTPKDPHSPTEGFFHSHAGWLFNQKHASERNHIYDNVPDMDNDPFYRFLNQTYPLHPALMAITLYAIGGMPYVLWGWAFRCAWMYHCTFAVNSAAHVWGYRSWKTEDTSKNNWWVAILAFGEGWHNNHHAFPRSARHGLAWWEFDLTWTVLKGLEMMGLATDIKLPTEKQMQRFALSE